MLTENKEILNGTFIFYALTPVLNLIMPSCHEKVKHTFQMQPPEVFYKQPVLKHFAVFTEKQLCWSLFFNKVAGLRPATF